MGVTEAFSTPTSPRVRRSLPSECPGGEQGGGLTPRYRRSFRTPGRSSWSSTEKDATPFGSRSARSSLRSSLNRGSPSPARKLTTPQGPNLATANRQRQCKCSETHHHGPHGHVTPVVPRVPLEKERNCRRSRGGSDEAARTVRQFQPRHSHSSHHHNGSSDCGSSKKKNSRTREEVRSPTPPDDDLGLDGYGGQQKEEEVEVEEESSLNGDGQMADDASSVSSTATSRQSADTKGSVSTMVNWVPWLAEKRYSTTLKFTTPPRPLPTTTRKGSGEIQYKIIHTSSSVTPSFINCIGGPPSSAIPRLTLA